MTAMTSVHETRFEEYADPPAESPTLIEGLPGLGMVASIAVDQITTQLDLGLHGAIRSDDFPPVAGFENGRVRDVVRVYAGADPDVMTLQSDIAIPPEAVGSLSDCVHSDLAGTFDRAVFLAGAPAESEEEIGDVAGLATTDDLEAALTDAGVPLAEESGVIGGVTGGLLAKCYREDVPATILVVRSNPYIPDPGAARAVIENALEPLVDFDIETATLQEKAQEIQQQKQQLATQLKQVQEGQGGGEAGVQSSVQGMYQ